MSSKALILVITFFTLLVLGMIVFAYLVASEQTAAAVKGVFGL